MIYLYFVIFYRYTTKNSLKIEFSGDALPLACHIAFPTSQHIPSCAVHDEQSIPDTQLSQSDASSQVPNLGGFVLCHRPYLRGIVGLGKAENKNIRLQFHENSFV